MVDKNTVASSLFWKFLERCTAQLVTLIVGIVLARLLAPEDFGALSILLVFVNLSVILTEAGFSSALIQKAAVDEKDYGTVLVLSLIIASFLYFTLFIIAPFIASFYTYPGLDNTMKIIALVLFPNAYNSVYKAKVAREFQYKRLFKANLAASVVSGIIGVILAYCGVNLWALVIQQLFAGLLTCLILGIQLRWCPIFHYASERAKKLFSFGWKLMMSSIIDSLFADFRTLLVGKAFDTNTLGFYSQARQYPYAISKNINTSIGTVMFPAMSNVQDNVSQVKALTRRSIKTSTYLVFPILLGFAAISDSFVLLVLTDKWASSIFLIKIICMAFLFEPIITINSQARNSIGKSDIHLKIVAIGKFVDFSVLILTWLIFNSIEAMAIGEVATAFIMALIGGVSNRQLIGYTIKEQLLDILPNLILSFIMFAVVYLIYIIHWPLLVTILLQILLGGTLYLMMSVIFRNESYFYLKQFIVDKLKR